MNFTSVVFIFIFLPIVLLGLWILKKLQSQGRYYFNVYIHYIPDVLWMGRCR